MEWRWRAWVVLAVVVSASIMQVGAVRRDSSVIGWREVRLGVGSILQALLDSQYSELVLNLDKAGVLEELEREVVAQGAITVFAPKNSVLDSELWRFLMQPGHEDALRSVLRYHVIPGRVEGAEFRNRTVVTLCDGLGVALQSFGLKRYVEMVRVFSPNSIVRRDGVVHGVDGYLVPPAVALAFEDWKISVSARGSPKRIRRKVPAASKKKSRVMMERAPPVVPAALLKAVTSTVASPAVAPSAPGPASLAPAPGPGTAEFSWDGEDETLQFVTALTNYGGYNDMAELLVNATTLGVELGKLARMGYKLTILAPNDQAMQTLTMEQLTSPLEPLLYYHFLSEYQTEESMYNAVKRLGKQSYSTLRHPHKVVASESDGTVRFGDGEEAAHIFDHDIYVDGHISIQGISRVLAAPP